MAQGPMGSWAHGLMGPWTHGPMDSWAHGPMGPWTHGLMGPWAHGPGPGPGPPWGPGPSVSQETLQKNGPQKNGPSGLPKMRFLKTFLEKWTRKNDPLGQFLGVLGGPYLASPENLLLGELLGTSFGAVRGPIRPFWKSNPILGVPSNPGLACLAGLGLLGYPSPRSGLARLACTMQQRHRPPSAAGAALRAAVVVAGAGKASEAGTRRG